MRTFLWWLGYLFLVSVFANGWAALSGAASGDAFERGVQAGEGFMNRFGVFILAIGSVHTSAGCRL